MIAWRAFLNMLRAAARDPVWAIVAVILNRISHAAHSPAARGEYESGGRCGFRIDAVHRSEEFLPGISI
jgi:hypothetical protein